MSQLKSAFKSRLIDHGTTQQEFPLGCLRIEPDDKEPATTDQQSINPLVPGYLYRERRFRYVENRSGGALNRGLAVTLKSIPFATVTANGGTTTTVTRASGSFISDGWAIGDIIRHLDDAGGAGAAPEGEVSVVTAVAALTVTFAPAFTTAVASSDTVQCIRPWSIKASVAGDPAFLGGLPTQNIANNEFGWIQTGGLFPDATIVAAGTTVPLMAPLYFGTALLTPVAPVLTEGTPNIIVSGTSYLPVAYALSSVTTDTVNRKAVVMLLGWL